MKYVLALDQGTTSSRAILFDKQGAIHAVGQREFPQIYPAPGHVEHDPADIWSSQMGALDDALANAPDVLPGDITAIGITHQRETTLLWDRRTGEPVANALVWQDRRTAAICDRLNAGGYAPLFAAKTGLVIDPYFSGTKLQWMLDNLPGVRERAERGELCFGTVDSFLVWKLGGGARHVTDVSNASRTLLFNIHTGAWDDELLALLQIPRAILPEVASSSETYTAVGAGHPLAGVPIAGIAGDQQAALFGQTCFAPGMAKNTYGTGCFLLLHTGTTAKVSANKLLTAVAWRIGDVTEYALEGSVFIGGAVVQWLRDGLGIIKTSSEIETLAATVPDNGGVYMVPAFTGLGTPHWDPYARGTIVGITRGTTAGHLARAALEAIAYQSYDVLTAMEKDAGIRLTELRVDGGASRNDGLMQFQADLLGVPVVRPRVVETTALGAACLAGLAVGFWANREEIARHWQIERIFTPGRPRGEMDALHENWQRAVGRSRDWVAP
ncbi:MAG: glycerol kinase GlpK [Akkermansiaceae bacterium]|nr:glycerol kinase GlpK [Armatimonadota bacterium]